MTVDRWNFVCSCEHYDLRGDLHRWCGPTIVVNFDKTNKRLQIYSTQQEVVRRASLLDASFMRVLRQKKLIHMQKDELTKRLNDTIKSQYVSTDSLFMAMVDDGSDCWGCGDSVLKVCGGPWVDGGSFIGQYMGICEVPHGHGGN